MKNGEKRGKSEENEENEEQVLDVVRPVLRRCAAKKVEALVTVPEALRSFSCAFKQVSTNNVTFVLEAAMEPAPIVGNVVTATFFYEGITHAFVGHITRYVNEGRRGPMITVAVPETVSSVEARRVYRVPADEEVPVTIVATFRGAKLRGELLDISRYGLRFRAERMSPRATRGVDVQVRLLWDGDPVTIEGRIASVCGDECAIGFMDETEVKESGYLRILSRQERVALQRRKEEEAAAEEARKLLAE